MGDIKEEEPTRILVTVHKRSPYWSTAWSDPDQISTIATQAVKDEKLRKKTDDRLLLVIQKWDHAIYLVLDVGNELYDAASGHQPEQNTLPVITVDFGTRVKTGYAPPPVRNRVNREVAILHNVNGIGSVPPFTEDHTNGSPEYADVRDPSLPFA
jgi:hypothetical protein